MFCSIIYKSMFKVVERLENIRQCLTRPSNMMVHMAADLDNISSQGERNGKGLIQCLGSGSVGSARFWLPGSGSIFFQCGSRIRIRIRIKINWILSTGLITYFSRWSNLAGVTKMKGLILNFISAHIGYRIQASTINDVKYFT